MTFRELVETVKAKASSGVHVSVGVEHDLYSTGDQSLRWKIYRSDKSDFYEGASPEAVLAKAFPDLEILDAVDAVAMPDAPPPLHPSDDDLF